MKGEVKRMNKASRALFTAVMGAALVAPIQLSSAVAAINATAVSGALSFSSGAVQIYGSATQTYTNPSTGNPLSLGVSGKTELFYVQNNGTLSASAFNVTISVSAGSIISLKMCGAGVLFTSTAGVCQSGTATTIPITSGVPVTISVMIAPNSFYNLELNTSNKNVTATINLSVDTSQVVKRITNS